MSLTSGDEEGRNTEHVSPGDGSVLVSMVTEEAKVRGFKIASTHDLDLIL